MNKILNLLILLSCLFTVACSSDEPDVITPIHFDKSDYTIMVGRGTVIPFTGGGGEYELSSSNPEVINRFGIDMEAPNQRLYVQPSQVGVTDLTIRDLKTNATVTLHFIVEDFYLSFSVRNIEGTNTNEFLKEGSEIRFIKNQDNTKPVKVVWYQNMTFLPVDVADGFFNIDRSDTNIFTMRLFLHHSVGVDSALYDYEYTMGGDGINMTIFDTIFDFGWDESIVSQISRYQPVNRIQMILTDKSNGCKITCQLEG